MKNKEWEELEKLANMPYAIRYKELLKKTEQEDEHPDWYDGPCLCQTCLSYADIQEAPNDSD